MTVGTTDEVLTAFVRGEPLRTRTAPVPGGRRLSAQTWGDQPGAMHLYSYRTLVAVRFPEGEIGITTRRYSRTTSHVLSMLRAKMAAAGLYPDGQSLPFEAAVPGRWGGYGPAWHPTGVEMVPFEVYAYTLHLSRDADYVVTGEELF